MPTALESLTGKEVLVTILEPYESATPLGGPLIPARLSSFFRDDREDVFALLEFDHPVEIGGHQFENLFATLRHAGADWIGVHEESGVTVSLGTATVRRTASPGSLGTLTSGELVAVGQVRLGERQ